MSFLKRLWPWAKKAITIEVKADVHPDLVRAIHFINDGLLIQAIDAIADFVKEDKARETHSAVISLLDSVEHGLRIAASELEMSFK